MNCQHTYGGHPCRTRAEHQSHKRQDAEKRDAACPPERRKSNRLRMMMQPTPEVVTYPAVSAKASKRRRNRKARQDRLVREASN